MSIDQVVYQVISIIEIHTPNPASQNHSRFTILP